MIIIIFLVTLLSVSAVFSAVLGIKKTVLVTVSGFGIIQIVFGIYLKIAVCLAFRPRLV
jgi:hypothetical protein